MPRRIDCRAILFNVRLQRGVAFGRPHRELEEPAVNGADLHGDGQAVFLAVRLAETGHAQEHFTLVPTLRVGTC